MHRSKKKCFFPWKECNWLLLFLGPHPSPINVCHTLSCFSGFKWTCLRGVWLRPRGGSSHDGGCSGHRSVCGSQGRAPLGPGEGSENVFPLIPSECVTLCPSPPSVLPPLLPLSFYRTRSGARHRRCVVLVMLSLLLRLSSRYYP